MPKYKHVYHDKKCQLSHKYLEFVTSMIPEIQKLYTIFISSVEKKKTSKSSSKKDILEYVLFPNPKLRVDYLRINQ